MESLITYLHQKSAEAGHALSMNELREIIKTDSSEYERINDDLQILYTKTFQYENMQRVLSDSVSINKELA